MTDDLRQVGTGRTDDGVPVGDADVQADVDRASGDGRSEPDSDEFLQEGTVEGATDQRVPVGSADAEEDRRRASATDESEA